MASKDYVFHTGEMVGVKASEVATLFDETNAQKKLSKVGVHRTAVVIYACERFITVRYSRVKAGSSWAGGWCETFTPDRFSLLVPLSKTEGNSND